MKKLILFFCIFFIVSLPVIALPPVLNFSDIISGPDTGIGDGNGSGAIVTIWGNNLDTPTITSGSAESGYHVYFTDSGSTQRESAYIYYWQNATGDLPGGPADVYSNHKLQEIAFSIPDSDIGVGNITVVTPDGTSNTLPFTVRTGDIYYIKTTGNDTTGDGSWSTPWLTYNVVMSGDGKIDAGDTIYSVGIDSTNGIRLGGTAQVLGTATDPISLICYPNSSCDISGEGGSDAVIDNWYPSNRHNGYVNYSKLSVTAAGNGTTGHPNGLTANPYNRIVGLEFTGPTVYAGYGGVITASGSSGNPVMGGKYFGINIHNYGYRSTTPDLNNYDYTYVDDEGTWTSPPYDGEGDNCTNCTSMDRFQHLYYLSIRQNDTIVDPYEIGWNNIIDNPILEGIHIYDMSVTGSGFNAPVKVHHNWIQNQGGPAIDTSLPYSSEYAVLQFYNNIIVSESGKAWVGGINVNNGYENVTLWNNTFYGYRIYGINKTSNNTLNLRNNIFVDTLGYPYSADTPNSYSDNLFYSTEETSNPAWYSAINGDINSDPLFTDGAAFNFTLQANSPVIDQGYDTSSLVLTDFFGNPILNDFDIGAVEYGVDETAPTPLSASSLADGTHVRLVASEAVQFGAGGTGGGAMTGCSGGATTLGTPSANGSYVEWPITNRTVYKDETSCVLAYTQPTDGLQDTSENDMATFDDLAVATTNAPALSTGTPTASASNSNGTSSASNTNGSTSFSN